jgi:DNA-binding beta-propeller fold protein YncE
MKHHWIRGLLLVCALLACASYAEYTGHRLGADRGQTMSSEAAQAGRGLLRGIGNGGSKRYIYAAFNDGSIHVYDIDDRHREIQSFSTVEGVTDVRGVCASAATGKFYVAHQTTSAGYVIAVDLYSNTVLWHKQYQPNVDRLSCTPDGRKLYIPCNESFTDACMIVADAATGDEFTRIHVSPRSHDCLISLSGDRVYIETKSSAYIAVIDTSTDTIIKQIGPFAGIGGPYTINGNQTRLYGNFFGVNGFQIGDITTGQVLGTAEIAGQTSVPRRLNQHGIGLRPDETEVWVTDGVGGQPLMHVFDVTVSPPQQIRDVKLSYSNPHWVTFTINGDFAYPSGPKLGGHSTDVIDTSTYERVASIGPSEDLLEVDFENGRIVRVGNQFGVGRVTQAP